MANVSPTLHKLWLKDGRPENPVELRLDWENDRHHAVHIKPPYTRSQVIAALDHMARLINLDEHLD